MNELTQHFDYLIREDRRLTDTPFAGHNCLVAATEHAVEQQELPA